MHCICAITNGDVSGRYKVFSLWVLIKDSTIGWVRVHGWVAERKRKHWGQGTEGLVARLKGWDCIPRIPSYSLRNTELTQNNDYTWNIDTKPSGAGITFTWLPALWRALCFPLRCSGRPPSRLLYKGPVTANQVMLLLQTKRRGRPDSSAKLVPNCCKSPLNSVRPKRPLSWKRWNILSFSHLLSPIKSPWQHTYLHFPEPRLTLLPSFISCLLVCLYFFAPLVLVLLHQTCLNFFFLFSLVIIVLHFLMSKFRTFVSNILITFQVFNFRLYNTFIEGNRTQNSTLYCFYSFIYLII